MRWYYIAHTMYCNSVNLPAGTFPGSVLQCQGGPYLIQLQQGFPMKGILPSLASNPWSPPCSGLVCQDGNLQSPSACLLVCPAAAPGCTNHQETSAVTRGFSLSEWGLQV